MVQNRKVVWKMILSIYSGLFGQRRKDECLVENDQILSLMNDLFLKFMLTWSNCSFWILVVRFLVDN